MSSKGFSEKRLNEWFYAIRGDAARHGVVDESTLFRMATEGRLHPGDLVWNKAQGDRWVLASSVQDLFPKRSKPDKPKSADVEPPAPVSKRHRTSLPVLLVVGVILISSASWLSQKLYLHEIQPSPRLVRLFGIETPDTGPGVSDIALQTRLIEMYLEREDTQKAQALIAELSKSEAHDEQAAHYRQRLASVRKTLEHREALRRSYPVAVQHLDEGRIEEADALIARLAAFDELRDKAGELARRSEALKRERQRKRTFVQRLNAGEIHDGNMRESMAVFRETKSYHELYAALENALRRRNVLPQRMCLSAARVYLALEQPTHAGVVMDQFVARVDLAGPEEDVLAAVLLFNALGKPQSAVDLLTDYLEKNQDKVDTRLEWAAMLAEADDRRAALAQLRIAINHGGNPARRKAVDDPRFDSIRDTWTFGRLVRMDD